MRQTTITAYEQIRPHLTVLQYNVYAAIRDSSKGLTDNEISSVTMMNPSTSRPRRIELQKLGYIRENGTKKQSNGRSSTIWIVNR